jgi:CubicO group peptidase (beta-lactamase class C family)
MAFSITRPGRAWIAAALLLAVSPATALAAEAASAAVQADTPATTASGAVFTLPKAWSMTKAPRLVVATPPETDARLALVDVPEAKDATAAAAAGWAVYRPDAKRVLKLVTPLPARDGWDERATVDYETSPNEQAVVAAFVLRKGAGWTVLILDGGQATVEKRGAAVYQIIDSLRPAGYARETFAGRAPHRLDAARIGELKAFVETSMKQLGVPGASIALVDQGRLVFSGGFGVRELGKPTPVDADTLFIIASNTKGMSTLLLAELVDEGKLAWDQPVTQVYPAFQLGSPETTSKVLVKHLVCACTGLPRKDFDWIFNTARGTPAGTTFDQLAKTEPTSGFGEVFQYNNLMASAAGYIGGHLVYPDKELGAAYDAAMQDRIFGPLGMKDTTFDMAKAQAGNFASPHGDDIDGKPAVAAMDLNYTMLPYRPAGGAWSSANDLIKYVQLELALGKLPDGKRLVSEKNLLARRAPGVSTGEDEFYGMGLEEDLSLGVTVVHHGGSMAGYKSDIIFLPDAQIGAVILTNADNGGAMLGAFRRRLLEVVYDGKPEAAGNVASSAAASQAYIAKARERLVAPPAPALAAALADGYANSELGRLVVQKTAGGVTFDFGSWRTQVASRVNDDGTVSFISIDPTVNGFEFVVGAKDGKRTLVLRDSQHEYVYVEGAAS